MVGAMRERIVLKSPINTPVVGGGHVTTWDEVVEVWTKVLPVKSLYGLEDSQYKLKDALKFTIRYRADIQPTWLIQYRGKDYTVTSIKIIAERDRFNEIVATTNNDNYIPATT